MLANKIRHRRVQELEHAGNSVDAFILKVGGANICKKCDPVRKLVVQEIENAEYHESCANSQQEEEEGAVRTAVRKRADVDDDSSSDDDDDEDIKNSPNGSANGGSNGISNGSSSLGPPR